MDLKLSKYLVISDLMSDPTTGEVYQILYSTRRGMGIKLTEQGSAFVLTKRFDLLPDRLFTILMYHEIVVPEDEDELQEVIATKKLLRQDRLEKLQESVLTQKEEVAAWVTESQSKNPVDHVVHLVCVSLMQAMEIRDQIENTLPNEWRKQMSYAIHIAALASRELEDCLPLSPDRIESLHITIKPENRLVIQYLLDGLQERQDLSLPIHLHLQEGQYDEATFADLDRLMSHKEVALSVIPTEDNKANVLEWVIERQHQSIVLPQGNDSHYWQLGKDDPREVFAPSKSKAVGYDDEIERALHEGKLSCCECTFLPLCGGNIQNRKGKEQSCPTFIKNFMGRTLAKYCLKLDQQPNE